MDIFLQIKKIKFLRSKKIFEKPKTVFAEKIIKGAYWNTGMFLINPNQ